MHLQFQTSDLVPPPYAHAIEIFLKEENNGLKLDFELSYLDREGLDLSEILEEGFTENDNFKWSGLLNENWQAHFQEIKNSIQLDQKLELNSGENFWQIELEQINGYPIDEELLTTFIQELQQAGFEASKKEAPLEIAVSRNSKDKTVSHVFHASFENREYWEEIDRKKNKHHWSDLQPFLKDLFSGEFRPDQANKNLPKKSGLFINLGDGLWYELGKSYLIQPSKIQKYLS